MCTNEKAEETFFQHLPVPLANFATFVSITLNSPPQKWMNLIFSSF